MKKMTALMKKAGFVLSTKGLPLMALAFASVLCIGKMYEPELPEELQK